MPEGDTVWRTAQRLHAALSGAPLVRADLRWPSIATARLDGDTTLEVVSRGKHILHRLASRRTLHSHLRMEGQWRVVATDRLTSRQLGAPDLRAALGTEEWTTLGIRLGMLDLVPTASEADLVGHLGPDLLGPDWDAVRATVNLSSAEGPIGAALLDQRNLAGLGTLWASEVLFLEQVSPWRPAAAVDEGQLARVVARAHLILDSARHHAVQSTTGDSRRGETTYVHRRSGRPCRRCGTTVRVASIGPDLREGAMFSDQGQRAMFYCPQCQGGLAPGDDGRPQRPLGASGAR
jgi:endonuclease VIII